MNTLSECAEALQTTYLGQEVIFSSVSTDTRTLEPGALFVALQGSTLDGHDYLNVAFQKGAVAALIDKPINAHLPCLKVPNTRQALGMLAKYHRQQFTIPVIALTGSCGKTTTKEYLYRILSQCGNVLASERSFNNDIGLPLTLLKLNKKHDFVVLEMGANAMGEIEELTHIAKPDIAIILNIAPAHLEGFGSIERVARAKSEIFQGLHELGIAIINTTVAQQWKQFLPSQKIIYFAQSGNTSITASSIRLNTDGCPHFILSTPIGCVPIQLKLPGIHQVDNALAAATTACQLNISLNVIKMGLELLTPIAGRLVMRLSLEGARILDDTYNANPSSMQAGLSVLAHHTGKRLLALGDMGELGKASRDYHAKIGEWARQSNIHALFTFGNQSRWAAQSFGKNAAHFNERNELIAALKPYLNKECTVLIKGSRAASMEKIVNALTTSVN